MSEILINIEETLERKIFELSKIIDFRDDDEEWRNKKRRGKYDDNHYFWIRCGERENYVGRLSAFEDLLKELKNCGVERDE